MPKDYEPSGRAQASDAAEEDALLAAESNAGFEPRVSDATVGARRTHHKIENVRQPAEAPTPPSDQRGIDPGGAPTTQGGSSTNCAVAPAETPARRELETIKTTNPGLRKQEVVRGSQPGDREVRHNRNVERFRRKGRGRLEASLETMMPRGRYGRLFGKIKRALIGNPISSEHSIHERLTNVKARAALYFGPNTVAAEMPHELGKSSCLLITRAQSGRRNIPGGAGMGFCCFRVARSDVLFLHTVLEEKTNER